MNIRTDTSQNHTAVHVPMPDPEPTQADNPWVDIGRFILIALLIVLPIRFFVAQPFIVSGASMEDTFHHNDYLIVDQVTYRFHAPERGDVIVFEYPRDPSKYFIKRIIGLPGETVTISGGAITIINDMHPEGIILPEPYTSSATDSMTTQTLDEDEYFVMGDNRSASSDSRTWGALREDAIVGRALIRLFPFAQASVFPGAHEREAVRENPS